MGINMGVFTTENDIESCPPDEGGNTYNSGDTGSQLETINLDLTGTYIDTQPKPIYLPIFLHLYMYIDI